MEDRRGNQHEFSMNVVRETVYLALLLVGIVAFRALLSSFTISRWRENLVLYAAVVIVGFLVIGVRAMRRAKQPPRPDQKNK